MTCRRNVKKLCTSLTCNAKINTPAIQHGKMYERKAILKFEEKTNLKTENSGLFICVGKPFLGATPDALVQNDTIVEVKCPFNGCRDEIEPGKNFSFLCYDINNHIVLNKASKYYDQVQGQLFVTKRRYCFFVVYTFKDIFVEKIEYDADYCTGSLIPKLELFYEKHFRPFIATFS